MQSFVLFASVLVAVTLIGFAFGQDYNYTSNYTEEYYYWEVDGTLNIPVDGRQAIESGRIYVQLPNGSTPINIRVRENVSVTLDCSHFVMTNKSISDLDTTWTLRRRNFNGDLESHSLVLTPETPCDGIEIFGNNHGFLRVANSVLASRFQQSNVGEFTCILCYNSVRRICNISKADIIGPLPNAAITVQTGDGTIASPPCLRTDNDLFVSCGDSLPSSTVAWYVNGVLQSGNTGFRQRATTTGNYTCVITNAYGSVTNTTFIKERPTIQTYSGNSINPGNNPIPSGVNTCISRNGTVNLVCVLKFNNESVSDVTFSWSTRGGGNSSGYNITASAIGVYTCTASNVCGSSQATTLVSGRFVNLVVVSPQGNRFNQLKKRPHNVDYCAFVGDSLTLSCNDVAPDSTTMINEIYGGTLSLTPVLPSTERRYLCITDNYCGKSSDMLSLRVYDPARIDRQQTLPPPGPNEEVIGAGRPDEPIQITPGSTVRLYCPFTGIDPANTIWLRVQPDRFPAEINTSLPAFSISNDSNVSVLTISPFTREFEGTYRCTTTNIAGDDAGDVVLQVTVDVIPEWVTSPWSECQPKCHQGMRMKLVHCVDRLSGRRLPDNRCTESKPLTMESCVTSGPCFTTPKWITGNWTRCSVSCGGGDRTRSVTCVIPLTGETVPDSRCEAVRKPRDHEYCNEHSCCTSDAYNACKYIAGTHSCSYGYMRVICCWTCRDYHYYY